MKYARLKMLSNTNAHGRFVQYASFYRARIIRINYSLHTRLLMCCNQVCIFECIKYKVLLYRRHILNLYRVTYYTNGVIRLTSLQ